MSSIVSAEERVRAVGPCITCWVAALAIVAAVAGSFAYLKLDFRGLLAPESREYMWTFALSFFPPDLSAGFLAKVGWGAVETLAISLVGTLLAMIGGLVLALPASGRYGTVLKGAARFSLNVLRSIPELVWAVLMVLAAGIGPFAGTLALGLHTAGVLGRLFAEALENVVPQPTTALTESGAPPALAFVYGTWPMILPQVVAYSLYRWEMNIRMATVLGFVGAGGLGQLLYLTLSWFQMDRAATVIIAMLALVIVVDGLSAWLRRGLTRAYA
jgi:phosphonate transport system permease protein